LILDFSETNPFGTP